jgi:hypothetical protein
VRIVKSVQTKVCVDGSLMKEFVLDEPLTGGFLEFLSHFGTVKQYPHLKRPYFSFEQEYFVTLKGFVGDTNIEVRYRKEFQDLTGDYFHLLLFYSGEGDAGKRKMKGIRDAIREKIRSRLPKQSDT